ncbi:MAG: proline racemase family protein, partial [Acidobacteriota bacterium]
MRTLDVIDSHTEGEPTRVVIAGGPDLGDGDVAERLKRFRRHHDAIRSAVVHEPRGFDALVGALLLEPSSPDTAAGMIFFNNADTL